MRISVVGGGYVGLVSAVCFSELGRSGNLIEMDHQKVRAINLGRPPIYEKDLEEMLSAHVGRNQAAMCYKDYWMFFDHISPLYDRCLIDVLELNGIKVIKFIYRFLPYGTKSRLPKSITFLRLYLKVPFIQRLIGKQALILSEKHQISGAC